MKLAMHLQCPRKHKTGSHKSGFFGQGKPGVNIFHRWVKLFPDGHFHAHKLFPEMMRESRLFMGYFNII